MNILLNPIFLSIIICVLFYWYLKKATQKPELLRGDFIKAYQFEQSLNQKLMAAYPHLNEGQTNEIISALRCYFQICNLAQAQGLEVAMPSKAVDQAWQIFMVDNEAYSKFCEQAFERFLSYSPPQNKISAQIKATFKLACRLFNISTKKPEKLPPLFAIDAQLKIADGYKYSPNALADKRKK